MVIKIGPVYQKFIIHDSQPINDGFCKIFEGINSTLLLVQKLPFKKQLIIKTIMIGNASTGMRDIYSTLITAAWSSSVKISRWNTNTKQNKYNGLWNIYSLK